MPALADHSLVSGSLEARLGPLAVSDSLRPFLSFYLVAEIEKLFSPPGKRWSESTFSNFNAFLIFGLGQQNDKYFFTVL